MTTPTPDQPVATEQATARRASSGVGAALIASGIFLSRILGLVRQMLQARYLGAGFTADAFSAAFKITNTLQNILGEGGLSASFIPVYSALLGRGEREEANRVAGAVAGLLALVSAAIVLLGILFAPAIIAVIASGFSAEKQALAIHLTRILFPGAGIFVLSAWCLGVLNSHRRFFLSYAAPVAWNLAMIASLLWYGPRVEVNAVAAALAWGSVAGAALQFGVQLPAVLRLLGGVRLSVATTSRHVRQVLRNFGPVAVSRGVVQISATIDQMIASWLPTGAVSMIQYAATLYVLPISLFGMAVSAAELPELARDAEPGQAALAGVRARVDTGVRRIAFFVVPSAVAFLFLGDVIIAAVLRSGRFGLAEARFTWAILAGSALGLLGAALARLYSSTYYAFNDTRTPFRYALVRIAVSTGLGAALALGGPRLLGVDARWGAAGLTVASSLAAWVEFSLLRAGIHRRLEGRTGMPGRQRATLWTAAVGAGAVGFAVKLLVAGMHRWVVAAIVLGVFAAFYGAATYAFGVPEARAVAGRLARRRGR